MRDLNDKDLRILREISKGEGLTIDELAKDLGMSASEMAEIIQNLVNKHYIEERIFKDRIDYVIDQKGIDTLKKLKK